MKRYQEALQMLMKDLTPHIAPAQRKEVASKLQTWFNENFQIFGVTKYYSEMIQESLDFPLSERLKIEAARQLSVEIFKKCAIDVTRPMSDQDLMLPTWDPKEEPRFHDSKNPYGKVMYTEIIAMRRIPND